MDHARVQLQRNRRLVTIVPRFFEDGHSWWRCDRASKHSALWDGRFVYRSKMWKVVHSKCMLKIVIHQYLEDGIMGGRCCVV